MKAVFWRLQMGGEWTVPAVELARGKPEKTALLVADAGYAGAAEKASELLAAGYRVIAADPFYFGESLFCFGLLEWFDVRHLAALVAPRPARFAHPTDRARTELAGLAAWYRLWEREFDPLR